MLFVAPAGCLLEPAATISVSSQGLFFGYTETVWKLCSRSDQSWNMNEGEMSCASSSVQAVARLIGRAPALAMQVKSLSPAPFP